MQRAAATRNSWKTQEMAASRVEIPLSMAFDESEYEQLRLGLVPREMEDKWFIFFEEDILYFHRSWTGMCVFLVRLKAAAGKYEVFEAWTTKEMAEKTTDPLPLLEFLINRLLLGKDVPFPLTANSDDKRVQQVFRHHIVGYGTAVSEELVTPKPQGLIQKLLAFLRQR
jgi:hypothetical protein